MTKERIMEAAVRLFGEKGYDATSIKDIAQIVGKRPSAIYGHFSSKEEIFLEVTREASEKYAEMLDRILAPVANCGDYKPEEVLSQVFEESILFLVHRQEQFCFWRRMLLFPTELLVFNTDLWFLRFNQKQFDLFSEIFDRGMRKGAIRETDPKAHITSFYALIIGFMTHLHPRIEQENDCTASVKEAWSIYWNGLAAKEGTDVS